ncbi:MAG: hypothetical protein ACR2HN_10505 [Tepidiformaceae bacterium]
MRFLVTVVCAALLLFLTYLFIGFMVDGYFDGNIVPGDAVPDTWAAPDSWSEWRDITFVLVGMLWLLSGALLVVLLGVLVFLALAVRRLLRENVAPAVDSLKETFDNVKGTAEFAGETIASPLIRTYALFKGVRAGVGAITNLPQMVRGRKAKKGRRR